MMGGGMGGYGGGGMMGGGMGGMGGAGGYGGGYGGGIPGVQMVVEGSGMITGVTITNNAAGIQQAVRDFFTANGLDFSPTSGKSIFFNERQGTLTVRATLQDLDVIEAAVQTLNVQPAMVNIRSKFADIGQDDNRALGFDWLLGNFLMGGGALGASGGTAPSYQGIPTRANPSGVFPGSSAGTTPTTTAPSQTDQSLTQGIRNSAPALGTLTGILTDPQFRFVIHAIDQRSGTELLAAPDITTLSGQQAQIRATDIKTIIINYDFSQAYGGGFGGGGGYGGGGYGGGGYGSDRNIKANFAAVNPKSVLAKVAALPITTWNYRDDQGTLHLGPMAQDFYAAFGLGTDDKHIMPVDVNGVSLAAIQGLNQKLDERDAKITALQKDVAELKAMMEKLMKKLDAAPASNNR
jgi:hypothetical protein